MAGGDGVKRGHQLDVADVVAAETVCVRPGYLVDAASR